MGQRRRGVRVRGLAAAVGIVCVVGAGCAPKPVDIQKSLQEQFITAKPGSVIDLPAEKIHLNQTLSLMVDHVTLRGKGMDKTILSFAGSPGGVAAGQIESGQGLLIKANDFTIEDLAIEDTAGDALTIHQQMNAILPHWAVQEKFFLGNDVTGNFPSAATSRICPRGVQENFWAESSRLLRTRLCRDDFKKRATPLLRRGPIT